MEDIQTLFGTPEWQDLEEELQTILYYFIPKLKLRLVPHIELERWSKWDETTQIIEALRFLAIVHHPQGLVVFRNAVGDIPAAVACINHCKYRYAFESEQTSSMASMEGIGAKQEGHLPQTSTTRVEDAKRVSSGIA
jgi:hypothetical protein